MICGVALALSSAPLASAEPIAIDVQVGDDPGIGFNDPVLGPQRLAAVRAAADRWGSFFVSSFPGETVPVVVKMVPSLVNDLGALTQVTATTQSTVIGDITVQWSIMEHTSGTDAFAGVDGLIQFSEAVDFYLGTDGHPGDRLDLMTLALHEMGHVFGFISNLQADGTYNGGAQFGAIPNLYDLFLENSAGVSLLALSPQERVAVITSGDGLFWGGPAGVAGNGGVRPNMSAPTQYLEGTSVVHISETFFPGDPLMDAALYPGDVIRTLTPVERGMFYDMGWTVPEPAARSLDAIAVLGILGLHCSRRPRRRWKRFDRTRAATELRGLPWGVSVSHSEPKLWLTVVSVCAKPCASLVSKDPLSTERWRASPSVCEDQTTLIGATPCARGMSRIGTSRRAAGST